MMSRQSPLHRCLWLAAAVVVGAAVVGAQGSPEPDRLLEELRKGQRFLADARYDDAYSAFTRALETTDSALRGDARKGRVRAALGLAQFILAGRDADQLHADQPDDVEALTLQADALWGRGLFDEAESAYLMAAARFPTSARARFGLARSHATRGQLTNALTAAVSAATLAPEDPEIAGFLASVYERIYRYEDAIRAYAGYLAVAPKALAGRNSVAAAKIRLLRGFAGRTPVAIDNEDAMPVHTVPFRLIDRKIVLEARVNGIRTQLVLDTGSERITLSRETANRADVTNLSDTVVTGVGPPEVRRLALGRVDAFEIGSMRIRNVPVAVGDPRRGIPRWQGEIFSPMALGLSVTVDYRQQQLTIGRHLPKGPADFTLPMRLHRLPLVRGTLNSALPAYFVVDTGGEMMSISTDVAVLLGPPPARRIPLKVFGVNGRDRDAFLWTGLDLGFANLAYPSHSVAVLNLRAPSVLLGFRLGGILGYAFLAPYRVTFDAAQGELRLERS